MIPAAYYNEIDKHAAAWLRELIKQGHIADGVVDERSIEDVLPTDLAGFTQCHFFAGIGVWSHALRNSGWSDSRQVWTGSCPCQPFSSAGKGKGLTDERHLWPAFHHLIRECRPVTVIGEQVANKAGEAWFDIVSSDMEAEGYAAGLAVFPACGVGAPHQRKRLYWCAEGRLADTEHKQQQRGLCECGVVCEAQSGRAAAELAGRGAPWQLANTNSEGRHDGRRECSGRDQELNRRAEGERCDSGAEAEECSIAGDERIAGPTNGYWRDADWLFCRDERWRPVEPSTFPLANGATERVGRLRGYGNAIVAQQAQAFIESYMECC